MKHHIQTINQHCNFILYAKRPSFHDDARTSQRNLTKYILQIDLY